MKPGDLVLFCWPSRWSKVDDPLDWENARIGIIIENAIRRPESPVMAYVDELLVMHEGQRWSVPSSWCKLIKQVE